MIASQIIRKIAKNANLQLDMVEKDYVLGWMLYGVSQSSIANKIVFKGGTALSKIYFPFNWRLSEDLDFTLMNNNPNWAEFTPEIKENIPTFVFDNSNITIKVKDKIHTNPGYLQSKPQYQGPTQGGKIKIEITTEEEIGPTQTTKVPQIPKEYDYPNFSINVYTLENIFTEKLRAIIQRGRMRDYYDTWRLLEENKINNFDINLFLKKCKSKGIQYIGIDQFFPIGKEEELEKYKDDVARMTNDKIDIPIIFSELKNNLAKIKGL